MIYENWLHTGSLPIKTPHCAPLKENIRADFLVIGGGFAGLHAALRLTESGKKVVLLEKTICGGSSSGKSGGFLTPESEKDIRQLIMSYGKEKANKIYKIPFDGVNLILSTIKKYKLNCDLRKQDSIYLSIKKSHDYKIEEEQETREELGMPSEFLDEKKLQKVHPGEGYTMGLTYPGSWGINSFAYCQEMKNLLIKRGAKIYESTEVHKIEWNTAKTHLGSVTAKEILICIDKMKSEFNDEVSEKLYHVQTYLAVSEPLSKEEMLLLFPKGKELMCWDTRLEYAHYRPVAGNRILIGGSTGKAAYYPTYYYSEKPIQKFIDEFKKRFPKLKHINFTHYWAGLIDLTQDFEPIIDYDKKNKSIQYALGCAGLNWAAYAGDYIARRAIDPKSVADLSEFTRLDRKFLFSPYLQKIFGKRTTFGLSHLKELLWG